MRILLIKSLDGSLKPADNDATESLKKFKHNDVIACDIKRPRNILHHRKYFSLLNIVLNNTDRFNTTEQVLIEIKLHLGHYDLHIVNGKSVYVPKSISFASMDQDTFNKFYSRTIDIILKYYLVGTDRQELENAVLSYC